MRLIALLLALTLGVGCSSTYQPVRSSRLSITWDGGRAAYVKEGRTYEGGMFGGQLEEAVKGSREAEQHAHLYRKLMITGVALEGTGLALEVGAMVLLLSQDPPLDETRTTVSLGLAFGGLALALAGGIFILNAEPHLYDAVNAYNDSQLPQTAAPAVAVPEEKAPTVGGARAARSAPP